MNQTVKRMIALFVSAVMIVGVLPLAGIVSSAGDIYVRAIDVQGLVLPRVGEAACRVSDLSAGEDSYRISSLIWYDKLTGEKAETFTNEGIYYAIIGINANTGYQFFEGNLNSFNYVKIDSSDSIVDARASRATTNKHLRLVTRTFNLTGSVDAVSVDYVYNFVSDYRDYGWEAKDIDGDGDTWTWSRQLGEVNLEPEANCTDWLVSPRLTVPQSGDPYVLYRVRTNATVYVQAACFRPVPDTQLLALTGVQSLTPDPDSGYRNYVATLPQTLLGEEVVFVLIVHGYDTSSCQDAPFLAVSQFELKNKETKTQIDSVVLYGFHTPMYGEGASDNIYTGQMNYGFYDVSSVVWLEYNNGVPTTMQRGQLFVAGKTYKARIFLTAKEGYAFDYDGQMGTARLREFRLEGAYGYLANHCVWERGSGAESYDRFVIVTNDLKVPESFTMTFEPWPGREGVTTEYTVLPGESFTLPDCTIPAYDNDHEFYVWEDQRTGKTYYAGTVIEPREDMTFRPIWGAKAAPCVLSFDKNGGSGVMPDIDHKSGTRFEFPVCTLIPPAGMAFDHYEYEEYNEYHDATPGDAFYPAFSQTIVVCWTDATEAGRVDVQVSEPSAGGEADTTCYAIYDQGGADADVVFESWKEALYPYTEVRPGTSDRFRAGVSYSVRLWVYPRDGWKLTDDTVFTVNGKEATVKGHKNSGAYCITADFDAITLEYVSAVSNILDYLIAGSKTYVPTVMPLAPSGGSQTNYSASIAYWKEILENSESRIMSWDETFIAGHSYQPVYSFFALDGYEFHEWTTYTVNGRALRPLDSGVYEGDVIKVSEHEHSFIEIPAVEATCTQSGKLAYWYCPVCEGAYADEAGTDKIYDVEWYGRLEPTGHTPFTSNWVYNDDLTARWHVCTTCMEAVDYESLRMFGDIDASRVLDIGDVSALLDVLARIPERNDDFDINADTLIDIADVTALLDVLCGV